MAQQPQQPGNQDGSQTGSQNKQLPKWWTSDHDEQWSRVRRDMQSQYEERRTQDTGAKSGQPQRNWPEIEPAVRFGHAAQRQYGQKFGQWNNELESNLRKEWSDMQTGGTWDDAKEHVRHGYESVNRQGRP